MTVAARRSPLRIGLTLLPLVAIAVAILAANLGLRLTPDAKAATGNVSVSATVTSVVTLTPCGASLNLGTLTMSSYNQATCNITFGATNNSALPLTLADNAGASEFFATNPSSFTETASSCAALAASRVGYKVSSGGLTATSNVCAPADTAATNTKFSPIPSTATTVCTTSALGNQVCPITVGILAPASATAGTNTGQLNFAA